MSETVACEVLIGARALNLNNNQRATVAIETERRQKEAVEKINFEKPSELLASFKEVILKETPVKRVYQELVNYVTSLIEPLDWKAIWRSGFESRLLNFDADLEVEVIDVSRSSLHATVIVKRLLSPKLSDVVSEEDRNSLQTLVSDENVITVPLIELYVINEDDDTCHFLQTAMAIEHVRFFWKCIWRPWDNSLITQFNDLPFIETHFYPRFDLYCDIQNKVVVQSTVNKIKKLLEEAWKVRRRLDILSSNAAEENVEKALDEGLVYETIKLRYTLEEMERAMKLFEDPYSRVIAGSVICNLIDEKKLIDRKNFTTIHILAKHYNYKMLKDVMSLLEITESQEQQIRFHLSLNEAISAAVSGDKIIIMPGLYLCDSIRWLEYDLFIEGKGTCCEQVVIQSRDDVGDVFLHCNANKIELSNITLRTSAATRCIIMVHSGLVRLNNCVLDGADKTQKALITLSKANVSIDNCNIMQNAANVAVIRSGGDIPVNGDNFDENSVHSESE